MQKERSLTNLQKCEEEKDATNKKYVDDLLIGFGNLASIGTFVASFEDDRRYC